MRYSSLVSRITPAATDAAGDPPDGPWEVHELALARRAAGEDITLLSIGQEADERTAGEVVDAAVASLRNGRHHYADVRGEAPLRESIARYHERLVGERVDPDTVTVFAGAQNALFACAQTLLEAGDEAILIAPYYTTYPATFAASGATLVEVATDARDGHRIDAEAVARAMTPRTRVLVLNVPGNPVGRSPDADTLARLVALCVEREVWLVLDAVYLDVVAADSVPSPHALPGAKEVLVTVGSLSKSHRMSGWRIGWTIAPPALATHFANLSMCMHYGLAPFVMDAARVALDGGAGTPRLVREALAARRALARAALGDVAPARLIDSGHGMFMLLDVDPLGIDARRFALDLLERHAVAVLPCGGFGPGGRTLVRIGLCVDGERLTDACRAVSAAVEDSLRPGTHPSDRRACIAGADETGSSARASPARSR